MSLFKKDPAMQKLKDLTGGLLITSSFEKKLKEAGLTAQDGYEIQQEIKESIKKQEVFEEGVETRLNYLIEQRKKAKGPKSAMVIDDETRLKLLFYIDRCEIGIPAKNSLKKEVREGRIKDMDTLNSKIDEIKEEEYQKNLTAKKTQEGSVESADDISQNNVDSTNPKETRETQTSFKPTSFKGTKSQDTSTPSEEEKTKNKEGPEEHVITPDKLAEMQKEDKFKELKFLLNQEHNLIPCPNCGSFILKGDKFCFNCGFDILKFIEDLNSGKIKISNGKSETIEDKGIETSAEDSTKDSKSSPKKSAVSEQKPPKASEMRAINLKFASVVFLYEKNQNPTKLVKESHYKNRYNTRLAKIKKYVREEGYVVDGTPLTAARGALVKDLKNVLKKHDLMVSGTKEELIQRLGENLSEEELKKAFPKKTLEVTDKGLEFIKNNEYVLYYEGTTQLRNLIPIWEYDSIFEDAENLDEKKIFELIDKYLKEQEKV